MKKATGPLLGCLRKWELMGGQGEPRALNGLREIRGQGRFSLLKCLFFMCREKIFCL
jgi:hypothetical protein